jgi:CheY-like chemotaxis protein
MMQPSELASPLADELRENGLQERVWVQSREKCPRILVAEDNLVNQKVVRTVLEKRGYEVLIANNGLEALAMLEHESFDAVLMDVQMPELDGIGATKRIRADARWQTLPIIAMTAHAMTGDKERCLKAGMDGYLSKPVAAKHLTAAIDKFIREKSESVKHNEEKPKAPIQTLAVPVGGPKADTAGMPIDQGRAAKMLDYRHDLQTGMTMLFLQVAPEHLQRLHSASVRRDSATLRSHAQRLERAAERIAATRIAARAHEIAAVSAGEDFSLVQDLLMALEADVRELESHVATAEAVAETAAAEAAATR